ncbi:hypothetical protein ABVT39_006743 [Epinephelus coioides]
MSLPFRGVYRLDVRDIKHITNIDIKPIIAAKKKLKLKTDTGGVFSACGGFTDAGYLSCRRQALKEDSSSRIIHVPVGNMEIYSEKK